MLKGVLPLKHRRLLAAEFSPRAFREPRLSNYVVKERKKVAHLMWFRVSIWKAAQRAEETKKGGEASPSLMNSIEAKNGRSRHQQK